jgi:short-subunit dehydrogenase
MLDLKGKTALVTGASSGIGREIARVLAREDVARLVIVARRKERLDELASELAAERPGIHVMVRPVDLSDRSATSALLDQLEVEGIQIDVLINNAGLAAYGPFAESSWDKTLETLDVNVVAPTMLLQRILPAMVKRGSGAVLNVGSSAGAVASPSLGVYAATKAYVNQLNEVLVAELDGTGVTVTGLLPGPVETEFQSVSGADRRPPLPRAFWVSAKQVAEQAVRGLKEGQARVVPGGAMLAAVLSVEAVPKAFLRPFLKRVARRFRPRGSAGS